SGLTSVADPLGNTTHYTLDVRGNVTTETDAAGNTTAYDYDSAGNALSITDPAGNLTRFAYDSFGRRTRQVNAVGDVKTFTYDANGNRLTESMTLTTSAGPRTIVTTSAYDASGNKISTTDAEGKVSRFEFDPIGNNTATIDALLRRTEMSYGDQRQPVEVRSSDGTIISRTFDAANRQTSGTDRSGRTTGYTFDAVGRPIGMTYPDATPTDPSNNP